MYAGQSGEFVCGSWGLKGYSPLCFKSRLRDEWGRDSVASLLCSKAFIRALRFFHLLKRQHVQNSDSI